MKMSQLVYLIVACHITLSPFFALSLAMTVEQKIDEQTPNPKRAAQVLWSELVTVADKGGSVVDWFAACKKYKGPDLYEIKALALAKYVDLNAMLISSRGGLMKLQKEICCAIEKMMEPLKPIFYEYVNEIYGKTVSDDVQAFFESWMGSTFNVIFFIPQMLMEENQSEGFAKTFNSLLGWIKFYRQYMWPYIVKITTIESFDTDEARKRNMCITEFIKSQLPFLKNESLYYGFFGTESSRSGRTIIANDLSGFKALSSLIGPIISI